MQVAVFVAIADTVALPPIENTACAVIDAAAVEVDDPSLTLTESDELELVDDADADAIRTLVAVDVTLAVAAAVVCSGPCP